MGKHPLPCKLAVFSNTQQTSGELLTRAERWQNMVREKIFTILLESQTGENKKATSRFPQAIFSGDDKYPPHLMTVVHILCDEMLLSNGKQHLWEVSHMLRLSQMLVTVPGTGSPVSELSTFPSMWCKALPALLPQQSQSWEVKGSVAGL